MASYVITDIGVGHVRLTLTDGHSDQVIDISGAHLGGLFEVRPEVGQSVEVTISAEPVAEPEPEPVAEPVISRRALTA